MGRRGREGPRDKGEKGQMGEGTSGRRDKGEKGQRGEGTKGRGDKGDTGDEGGEGDQGAYRFIGVIGFSAFPPVIF